MADDVYETGAPFNMAIATLMSLRRTLDMIRDVEGRLDFPPEERQRIKIELVKRFYVDSTPLIFDAPVIEKYENILDIKPLEITFVDKSNVGSSKKRITYSFELNKKLDICLRNVQIELQKKKYFMPPKDDLGMSGMKMS